MDDTKLEELEKAYKKKTTKSESEWSRHAWFACTTCPWKRLLISWSGAPHGSAISCTVTTKEASKASGIFPDTGGPEELYEASWME